MKFGRFFSSNPAPDDDARRPKPAAKTADSPSPKPVLGEAAPDFSASKPTNLESAATVFAPLENAPDDPPNEPPNAELPSQLASNSSTESAKRAANEREWFDVEAAKRGDLDAFDRLVLRHQDRVFNLCRWIIGDDDDAADAAQEAFVRAFRFLPKFRGDASFSTWIGHISTNVARDFAARRKKAPLSFSHLSGDDDEPDFEPISPAISPSESLLKVERRRAVHQAMARLPESFRLVLILYDLEGHSYEECAAQLKIPLGTVKSRLNRARQALREALGADRELFES